MPGALSIYWNSVGSQRSSRASSGDTATGRQYVDPWDLENYAYLRRHSVATVVPPPVKLKTFYRKKSEPEPEYWYAPSSSSRVEPGYTTPASVEELYFGSSLQSRRNNNNKKDFAPLYQPLSELDYQRFEDLRIKEVIPKRRKILSRAKVTASDLVKKREPIYHSSTLSTIQRETLTVEKKTTRRKNQEDCYVQLMIPASKFHFSRHGHLKIDYTSSWNSLHRKIISK